MSFYIQYVNGYVGTCLLTYCNDQLFNSKCLGGQRASKSLVTLYIPLVKQMTATQGSHIRIIKILINLYHIMSNIRPCVVLIFISIIMYWQALDNVQEEEESCAKYGVLKAISRTNRDTPSPIAICPSQTGEGLAPCCSLLGRRLSLITPRTSVLALRASPSPLAYRP